MLSSPFVQKLIWTVLAVSIYALAAWPPIAPVAEVLKLLAGGLGGGAWVTRPGDGKLIEAGKQAMRNSDPPKAGAAMIVFALLLCGCGAVPPRAEYPEHAARAEALDEQLDAHAQTLAIAEGGVLTVCGWRGDDAAECKVLRATLAGLKQTLATARAALALYQSTGIAVRELDDAIATVGADAANLAAESQRLGEIVLAEAKALKSGGAK